MHLAFISKWKFPESCSKIGTMEKSSGHEILFLAPLDFLEPFANSFVPRLCSRRADIIRDTLDDTCKHRHDMYTHAQTNTCGRSRHFFIPKWRTFIVQNITTGIIMHTVCFLICSYWVLSFERFRPLIFRLVYILFHKNDRALKVW